MLPPWINHQTGWLVHPYHVRTMKPRTRPKESCGPQRYQCFEEWNNRGFEIRSAAAHLDLHSDVRIIGEVWEFPGAGVWQLVLC
jgi:hypothetical protein